MVLSLLSLILTAVYVGLISEDVDTATAVGPIYTLAVVALWAIGYGVLPRGPNA